MCTYTVSDYMYHILFSAVGTIVTAQPVNHQSQALFLSLAMYKHYYGIHIGCAAQLCAFCLQFKGGYNS